MRDNYISLYQARYATSIVSKYTDTFTVKTSRKFYNTNFPSDMILTKNDVSTSDEQVYKLTREYIIICKACIVSLIYFLSKILDLSFSVHKLAKFS